MPRLLRANGVDLGRFHLTEQLAALVDAGRANADELARRGHALPGAADSLSQLAARPDVMQSVTTGNIEENARLKLAVFDLDRWIEIFGPGGP